MDIKAARKILGLSQEAFAQKLEVSVRTIGNWEKGVVDIPAVKVEKIKALVAGTRQDGDFIDIGSGSPGSGKIINTDLSKVLMRAFDEIEAQRKLTEEAQRQSAALLEILKSKIANG